MAGPRDRPRLLWADRRYVSALRADRVLMPDYIIVGAGSAGCVLANRLTENSAATVLLLEAGGPDDHAEIRIPALWGNLMGTALDWSYRTEPQPYCNNRVL